MDTSIDDRIIDPNGTDHDFYWVIDGRFSGDLGYIFSPLALGLGLIGEIIVVFILKQEYKGDPKRLHQIMPFDKKARSCAMRLDMFSD